MTDHLTWTQSHDLQVHLWAASTRPLFYELMSTTLHHIKNVRINTLAPHNHRFTVWMYCNRLDQSLIVTASGLTWWIRPSQSVMEAAEPPTEAVDPFCLSPLCPTLVTTENLTSILIGSRDRAADRTPLGADPTCSGGGRSPRREACTPPGLAEDCCGPLAMAHLHSLVLVRRNCQVVWWICKGHWMMVCLVAVLSCTFLQCLQSQVDTVLKILATSLPLSTPWESLGHSSVCTEDRLSETPPTKEHQRTTHQSLRCIPPRALPLGAATARVWELRYEGSIHFRTHPNTRIN